ncbi:tetratricopeptide repeat protein [Rhodovulum strictum]|uniref:Sel1 repeat-containing protein n=1 Tax=Rhodovulum strictum TaxID=58314 RepID=A0A844B3J5_9RHOB|nr:SEL1-like repeat protein [Rhodovulum strictum]MRH20711.1 hypothetical protein [Rhodovulum strictum]
MTGGAAGDGGGLRLADLPVVFLSYDEPWADETWAALQALRPDSLRVHGVRGLNACHVAAADAAASDWFLTVDADTTPAPGLFDQQVPAALLQPVFRLDWLARNAVNGIVSGNGCVKLWPRELVLAMRSHEAAPRGRISLDADIGQIRPGVTRNIAMPGCHAVTDPAHTPFHAFRAGFREATFLAHLRASAPAQPAGDALRRLIGVWASVGAHARNGLWVIHGARLALWMALTWQDRDLTEVNDPERMRHFWQDRVLPRLGPGAGPDIGRLRSETAALGAAIAALDDSLPIADLDAAASRLAAGAGMFGAAHPATAIDGLGRSFQKGRGVGTDIATARACFETAALLGHAAAVTNLGRLHELGLDAPPDPAAAERYYRAATAMGSAHAPSHLAQMLLALSPADPAVQARAEGLLDLAAERGHAGPAPQGSAA